jgi:hypothetical protein
MSSSKSSPSSFWASILSSLLVLAIGLGAFNYYAPNTVQDLLTSVVGCRLPMTYRVGNVDSRFGLSQADALNAVADAEAVWEKPANINLFAYEPGGQIVINFVYDDRQKETDLLKKLNLNIDTTQASFNQLKNKYDQLKAQHVQADAVYEGDLATFQTKTAAYDKEVSYWNSQGGAPKAEYDRLTKERDSLAKDKTVLEAERANVNQLVDTINALVDALNRIGTQLNLDISQYNTSGSDVRKEFEEGLYYEDAKTRQINIYQFENHQKLVDVLAHEMGHALGLGHIADPHSVMYRLNQSENQTVTDQDLALLRTDCKLR